MMVSNDGINKSIIPALLFLTLLILGISAYAINYYANGQIMLSPDEKLLEINGHLLPEEWVNNLNSDQYRLLLGGLGSMDDDYIIAVEELELGLEWWSSLTIKDQEEAIIIMRTALFREKALGL